MQLDCVARKLLVVVWHVLTAQVADRQADPQAVARSLMTWATRYGLATSLAEGAPSLVRAPRVGSAGHWPDNAAVQIYYHFPLTMPATVTEEEVVVVG